jgi:hypothetical protein
MKPSLVAVLVGLLGSLVCGSLVLGSLVLGSLVLGAPAASAATPSPTVLSARATPSALGPAGGQVLVSGTVNNANTCQLVLLSRQSFPVVYSHNPTVACQGGAYSARVTIGANPSATKRTVAFALVARNGTYSSRGYFYVALEPLLVPTVLSARATPSALGPGGGRVIASGTVKNANTCQLVLLSHQSFPVVYSHNPTTACQGGNYSAHVTIGANPSATKRTVAFVLVARNGIYTSRGYFYVALEPLLVPTVLSASATPSALGPAGGQVLVSGTVKNANTCRLLLLSHQSFPVVYSHNPTTACQGGNYSGHVTIGANPSAVKRTVAFALVARNGTYSSIGYFYVSLVASPTPLPYPPPPPTPAGPSRYPAGVTGYDVSWPQCTSRTSAQTKPLPGAPSYAVVGVNNGTIGTLNSCFAAEAAWAGKNLSVYIILQPAPGGKPVPFESAGPEASCASTNSECEGYDWGYNYAETDIAFVKEEGADPKVWWVDVETAEGWPTSPAFQPVNAAIIQGALAAIKQAGEIGGIYCTWYQWGKITGSYVPLGQTPLWVAGALSLSDGYYSAQSYCQRALSPGDPATLRSGPIGFAGGVPWLVQYGYAGYAPTHIDVDYSCG